MVGLRDQHMLSVERVACRGAGGGKEAVASSSTVRPERKRVWTRGQVGTPSSMVCHGARQGATQTSGALATGACPIDERRGPGVGHQLPIITVSQLTQACSVLIGVLGPEMLCSPWPGAVKGPGDPAFACPWRSHRKSDFTVQGVSSTRRSRPRRWASEGGRAASGVSSTYLVAGVRAPFQVSGSRKAAPSRIGAPEGLSLPLALFV